MDVKNLFNEFDNFGEMMTEKMTTSFSSLRSNNDLYDDEEGEILLPSVRVRRIELPKNGEDWEVSRDGEPAFRLRGINLTKKEKNFLRTPSGMTMLMGEYKKGNRSVTKIKKKIKELVDND